MWITISEKGISEPFCISKIASLTESMHKEDCVKQRFVPFLEEHHADAGGYFFWPDLAIVAIMPMKLRIIFNKLEIPFILRGSNLPNSPQLRPI